MSNISRYITDDLFIYYSFVFNEVMIYNDVNVDISY